MKSRQGRDRATHDFLLKHRRYLSIKGTSYGPYTFLECRNDARSSTVFAICSYPGSSYAFIAIHIRVAMLVPYGASARGIFPGTMDLPIQT